MIKQITEKNMGLSSSSVFSIINLQNIIDKVQMSHVILILDKIKPIFLFKNVDHVEIRKLKTNIQLVQMIRRIEFLKLGIWFLTTIIIGIIF